MECGNSSPTRSWETCPACGCWPPNCCGWGPGTWCAIGRDNDPNTSQPRLALQLIHEAALCITGLRLRRGLNQHIFELANGLPFLAADMAIHELLAARTVLDSQRLQVALGKVRRASGHFQGRVLAIDPHRVRSFSKRHMRRHRSDQASRPTKTAQTFFVLDADTHQPVCFTTGTSARTASNAAEELLGLAADILDTQPGQTLVLADAEHFTVELLDKVKAQTNFDLLVPMPDQPSRRKKLQELPPETFQRRWAGYATAKLAYTPRNSRTGPFYQYVQRQGERPEEHHFKAFLSTTDRDEVETLTEDFPKRWHVEEFFNAHQALGWDRAGTCNLNIRYGQMTMALIAQAAIDQAAQTAGAIPARAGMRSTWPRLTSRGWKGTCGSRANTIISDILQCSRCRQAAGAIREPAGQAQSREHRPADSLALRVRTRFSLPMSQINYPEKSLFEGGAGGV